MTKKHIYVNGRIEDVGAYQYSKKFKSPPEYSQDFFSKLQQHEYGYIELEDCYIHFIVGNLPRKGCLYCGAPMKFEQKEKEIEFGEKVLECTFFCTNCSGRGRTMNVRESALKDSEMIDLVKELLEHSQKHPRTWFDDFENPWEKD